MTASFIKNYLRVYHLNFFNFYEMTKILSVKCFKSCVIQSNGHLTNKWFQMALDLTYKLARRYWGKNCQNMTNNRMHQKIHIWICILAKYILFQNSSNCNCSKNSLKSYFRLFKIIFTPHAVTFEQICHWAK